MEKVVIIIPAYNEEKRIGKTLEAYGLFFDELKRRKILDYEILVVINNTRDKTEEIVKKYQKKNNNLACLSFKEGGKGLAIIAGFKEALKDNKNSLVGFVDADMATSPHAFYDLIKNINGNYGIIASRYASGAIVKPKQTLNRIFVSRIFNLMVRGLFLLSFKDTQCGAKIFRRKAIEKILPLLGMTQWAIDVDLLYHLKQQNLSVREFPTIWKNKDESKLNLKRASIQMFFAIIQLRILNSPFKRTCIVFNPIIGTIWKIVK